MLQVNAVNCNTSWKVTLFMKFSDYREDVLKGVWCFIACNSFYSLCVLAELFVLLCRKSEQTCTDPSDVLYCMWPLSGRRSEAVSCWAGEVSDLWRVQEAAACLSQDHTEAVCHVSHQLQGSLGGRGKPQTELTTSPFEDENIINNTTTTLLKSLLLEILFIHQVLVTFGHSAIEIIWCALSL